MQSSFFMETTSTWIVDKSMNLATLHIGHIWIRSTVPYREAVLISEINSLLHFSGPLYRGCPYLRESFIRGTTDQTSTFDKGVVIDQIVS